MADSECPKRSDQMSVDLWKLDTAAHCRARRASELPVLDGALVATWWPVGECCSPVLTQLKSKGEVRCVGIATGMNSLIRPALYGAYHEITNLTRIDEPPTELVNVVGPICESADVLGHDRLLPRTREGDVLLIANTGAYGYAMSSHYNLRDPRTVVI